MRFNICACILIPNISFQLKMHVCGFQNSELFISFLSLQEFVRPGGYNCRHCGKKLKRIKKKGVYNQSTMQC